MPSNRKPKHTSSSTSGKNGGGDRCPDTSDLEDIIEAKSSLPGNDLLHATMTYAKRGWAVLPLWWPLPDGQCACDDPNCDSVGKHPIGKPGMAPNGGNSATNNTGTIRAWWRRYPQANVQGNRAKHAFS